MKTPSNWYLASTPQKQPLLFPEASDATRKSPFELEYGFNRAKLAWNIIDPGLLRSDPTVSAPNIVNDKDQQSDPYVREVLEQEIFPNKQPTNGVVQPLAVLNLSYYPKERGPYNFDVKGVPGISRGINADGTLVAPSTRWGGIMRKIETNDFEAGNVETIEFWLMDPFIKDTLSQSTGGQLYFNLGNISEDILRDSRELAENGLPTAPGLNTYDNTAWGRVPKVLPPVNAFDNDPATRTFQDVGLDGLGDDDERSFYKAPYLDKIAAAFGPSAAAYNNASNDPSGDNYHYFRGDDYDSQNKKIQERYKDFNNTQGNSPVNSGAYPTSATNMPDAEDVNRDNNMNDTEDYFQYRVNIVPNTMRVGQNFITDILEAEYTPVNAQKKKVKWYHFKIPIQGYEQVMGNIQDFRSIGWIRMFVVSPNYSWCAVNGVVTIIHYWALVNMCPVAMTNCLLMSLR
jgi:cell surface protein SprA